MPTTEDLRKMREVDGQTVNADDLIDLESVTIDDTLPVKDRMLQFIDQIKNPYCFRVNGVVVKIGFTENGPSFQQNFEDMLMSM